MNNDKYVIGVDYGTLSGRALLVRVSDGFEVASAVHPYEHGVMDQVLGDTGIQLGPDWALQDAQDYLNVLKTAIPEVLAKSSIDPLQVVGIATDFTASTPMPTLKDGTPLSFLSQFAKRPHAYVKLWKHHSASGQANRINELALARNEYWISRYGGKISSEWQFAKALQLCEEDKEIYDATEVWIEAADWIVWQLSGNYIKNICSAGYKGIYQDGEYPSKDFLAALNPNFENFVEQKLEQKIGQLGASAGKLTDQAASWTGLPAGISVSVGNIDAHVTAASAQATEPGQMVAIMGTSTCHVMVGSQLKMVPGMCGVVNGGIVPGKWGYEAGQSGVGDILAWFVNRFITKEYESAAAESGLDLHDYLAKLASKNPIGSHGLLVLDWMNGNRSTLVDQELSGLIVVLTLATKPEEIYQALIEATAFGARKIVETFNESQVPVIEFIASGGLIKSKFVMQIYADVLNRPIHITQSEQGPALGSAIHAAVAAGEYQDIQFASKAMGKLNRNAFLPNPASASVYDEIYKIYSELYENFGEGRIMHRLRALRNETVSRMVE